MKQFEGNIAAIEIDSRYFGVNDMVLKKYFAIEIFHNNQLWLLDHPNPKFKAFKLGHDPYRLIR